MEVTTTNEPAMCGLCKQPILNPYLDQAILKALIESGENVYCSDCLFKMAMTYGDRN